ncbi:PilN domain-containing protein [Niveispirillum sp. KHB5.9]|uniref:PilN domain-containing protein n=1 Tax=Niveispirillum sp. KHB5.9 TaxID=3400269 RepID=UPI003A87247B
MSRYADMARRLAGWWLDRSLSHLPRWLTRTGPDPVPWRLGVRGLEPLGVARTPWHLRLDGVAPLTLYYQLPATARPHLRRLVGMQLGHWTPLTPETALYDAQVEGTAEGGVLNVRIDALPRARIAAALTAAADRGMPPPLAVELAGATLPMGDPLPRRLPPRLLLACLLLLVPPLALALSQEGQLIALRTEVEAGTMEAAQARALGQRVSRLRTDTLAAVTARREAPSQLVMLERLSALLPDSSYLTELRVEGDRIHLLGYSRDGAALPSLLSTAARFEDVRFEAPLLRSGPQGDRFHLSLKARTDAA